MFTIEESLTVTAPRTDCSSRLPVAASLDPAGLPNCSAKIRGGSTRFPQYCLGENSRAGEDFATRKTASAIYAKDDEPDGLYGSDHGSGALSVTSGPLTGAKAVLRVEPAGSWFGRNFAYLTALPPLPHDTHASGPTELLLYRARDSSRCSTGDPSSTRCCMRLCAAAFRHILCPCSKTAHCFRCHTPGQEAADCTRITMGRPNGEGAGLRCAIHRESFGLMLQSSSRQGSINKVAQNDLEAAGWLRYSL